MVELWQAAWMDTPLVMQKPAGSERLCVPTCSAPSGLHQG